MSVGGLCVMVAVLVVVLLVVVVVVLVAGRGWHVRGGCRLCGCDGRCCCCCCCW